MSTYNEIMQLINKYQSKESQAQLAKALHMKPSTLQNLFDIAKQTPEAEAKNPHSLLNVLINAIKQFEAQKKDIELVAIINQQNAAIQQSIAEFMQLEKEANNNKHIIEDDPDVSQAKANEHEETLQQFLAKQAALEKEYKEQTTKLGNLLNDMKEIGAKIDADQKNVLDKQTALLNTAAKKLDTMYEDLNKSYNLDQITSTDYNANDDTVDLLFKDLKYAKEQANENANTGLNQVDLFRNSVSFDKNALNLKLEIQAGDLQMRITRLENRASKLEEQENELMKRGIHSSKDAHLLDNEISKAAKDVDQLDQKMQVIQNRIEKLNDVSKLSDEQQKQLKNDYTELQELSTQHKQAKKALDYLNDLNKFAKNDTKREMSKEVAKIARENAQDLKNELKELRESVKGASKELESTHDQKAKKSEEVSQVSTQLTETGEKIEKNKKGLMEHNNSLTKQSGLNKKSTPQPEENNEAQHSRAQSNTYAPKK